MAHTVKIEGSRWELYEDEHGTYLHLYEDDGKVAISIGHPDDTLDDFLGSLMVWLDRSHSHIDLPHRFDVPGGVKIKEVARGNGVCDNCERRAETVIHFGFPLPFGPGTHHLFKMCQRCTTAVAIAMRGTWRG